MTRHLFISQPTLDSWIEQEKIQFSNNMVTIKADGRSFRLIEAVRFIQVEGGDQDRANLLGKVKTVEQLKSMGAERCSDSVILEEVAYKIQVGFLGEIEPHADVGKTPAMAPTATPGKASSPMTIPTSQPPPIAKPVAVVVLSNRPGPSSSATATPAGKPPVAACEPRPLPQARTQPNLPVAQPASKSKMADLGAKDIASAAAMATGEKKEEEVPDEELLTKFLLENL